MNETSCEKCGAAPRRSPGGVPLPLDYCAFCGAHLCDECGTKGHCFSIPAMSGMYEEGIKETNTWGPAVEEDPRARARRDADEAWRTRDVRCERCGTVYMASAACPECHPV